jgi:hypothetical protein
MKDNDPDYWPEVWVAFAQYEYNENVSFPDVIVWFHQDNFILNIVISWNYYVHWANKNSWNKVPVHFLVKH